MSLMVQVLAGVLPPVTVAAVALSAAWKPWQPAGVTAGRSTAWGATIAIGLGYAAGHVATQGWPRFHPWPRLVFQVPVRDALFYLAVGALLVGLAGRGRVRAGPRALASIAAPLYLLDFMRRHHWSSAGAVLWPLALGLLLFVGWTGLDALARRRPGASVPAAWLVVGALSAGAILLSGSASLAQLAGVWAAPLGVAWLLALRQPRLTLAGGGVACTSVLHAGLLWAACFGGELRVTSALLLGAAPLGAWIGEVPGLSGRPKSVRALARVVASAAPAAAAVLIELGARPTDPYAGY